MCLAWHPTHGEYLVLIANLTSKAAIQHSRRNSPRQRQPSGFRVNVRSTKVFSVNFFACAEGANYV